MFLAFNNDIKPDSLTKSAVIFNNGFIKLDNLVLCSILLAEKKALTVLIYLSHNLITRLTCSEHSTENKYILTNIS